MVYKFRWWLSFQGGNEGSGFGTTGGKKPDKTVITENGNNGNVGSGDCDLGKVSTGQKRKEVEPTTKEDEEAEKAVIEEVADKGGKHNPKPDEKPSKKPKVEKKKIEDLEVSELWRESKGLRTRWNDAVSKVTQMLEKMGTDGSWGWCSEDSRKNVADQLEQLKGHSTSWMIDYMLSPSDVQFRRTRDSSEHITEMRRFLRIAAQVDDLSAAFRAISSAHQSMKVKP